MRRIHVVAGIARWDDHILLLHQRADGHSYWSLPGGVVADGETLTTALRRELH